MTAERKKPIQRAIDGMAKGLSWGDALQRFKREEMHERDGQLRYQLLVYATASISDVNMMRDLIARAMRAASSVKPRKKALSHQPGVVRQRPAFGHRLACIETARLEKFPTNVPGLVRMTRSAKSKLTKQPKPRRQVRGSRQPGHWLLQDDENGGGPGVRLRKAATERVGARAGAKVSLLALPGSAWRRFSGSSKAKAW
jgi:hypothetical protein